MSFENLTDSARMAIILLGRDLRICRFTSVAEKLFNLVAIDIECPLVDAKKSMRMLLPTNCYIIDKFFDLFV